MKIPDDVRAWVRQVFRACNVRTANAMSMLPNAHETSLDLAFIAEAGQFAAPVRLPSEWIVRIDTHFLGGGRHFGEWEIADIGVLVQFRRAGKVIKNKVLLLQSKKLYPRELEYDEDERADYEIGFARLFRGDAHFPSVAAPRVFTFNDDSKDEALKTKDHQYTAIESYEGKYGLPVYYMLYHPAQVPWTTEVPRIASMAGVGDVAVGARVVPAANVRTALATNPEGYAPRYRDLKQVQPEPRIEDRATAPGWLVEHFIADLAINCKVGHIATSEKDEGLFRVFNRRSGPISAAIAITFDAPLAPGTTDEPWVTCLQRPARHEEFFPAPPKSLHPLDGDADQARERGFVERRLFGVGALARAEGAWRPASALPQHSPNSRDMTTRPANPPRPR